MTALDEEELFARRFGASKASSARLLALVSATGEREPDGPADVDAVLNGACRGTLLAAAINF